MWQQETLGSLTRAGAPPWGGVKPPSFVTPVLGGEAPARRADAWGGCQLGISSPSIIQQLIKNKIKFTVWHDPLSSSSQVCIKFSLELLPRPPRGKEFDYAPWEAPAPSHGLISSCRCPQTRKAGRTRAHTQRASFSASQRLQTGVLLQGAGGYFSSSISSHHWVVWQWL